MEFQRWRSLSSSSCHFCPNGLDPPVIQIAGIQKQFKNCPAKPIRPCFANMAQAVFFLLAPSHPLCRLRAVFLCVVSLRRESHKLVMSFLTFLSIRQKREMFSISRFRRELLAQCSGQELNFTVRKNCGVEISGGGGGGAGWRGFQPLFSSPGSPQKSSAVGNNEANTSADRNPGPPAVSSV